jgi:REP element-mobilizing transposase RayT
MPRAGRSFEEGRIYHVYNRVGGGGLEFEDEALAEVFVAVMRWSIIRDDAALLGWCLLGNHYHLIIRQGPVALSKTLKTLQQKVTRARNIRQRTFGPLWQGRFKAKEVSDQKYLMQLVGYVHLNPVKAGLSDNVDGYRWSGHRDIIGRNRKPIVTVDDVLLLYGETRRTALRNYRAAMASIGDAEWSSDGPGRLPWWRVGRPTEEERLRKREAAFVDEQGRTTGRWRPVYGALEWIEFACQHTGIDPKELAGRGRQSDTVRTRDLIGLVGIERYGVQVTEMADALGKSRDGVSRWYRRGAARRDADPDFAAAVKDLDQAATEDP